MSDDMSQEGDWTAVECCICQYFICYKYHHFLITNIIMSITHSCRLWLIHGCLASK